jgi:gas vesicle protein
MEFSESQRDIARFAVQSAVASAAAYTAVQFTSTGAAFLAVISAVLVLQANREKTLQSAGSRMAGTLVGTLVGAAALALTNEATIALELAAVMFVMGGIAAWKPAWSYGVVAAAGLAVGSDLGFWETALNRGVAIFVGAFVGIAAGLLVWPESARTRARRQMGEALSICRDLLVAALQSTVLGEKEKVGQLHSRFAVAFSEARETASSLKVRGGHSEQLYADVVHRIERLWHALLILDRTMESKNGGLLPVDGDTVDKVKAIQTATCEALECAAQFERIPHEDLEVLKEKCREIWREAAIDTRQDDTLPTVALIFGLSEVSRNMSEIDEAIGALDGSG